jgi:hypothetical protein
MVSRKSNIKLSRDFQQNKGFKERDSMSKTNKKIKKLRTREFNSRLDMSSIVEKRKTPTATYFHKRSKSKEETWKNPKKISKTVQNHSSILKR